MNHYYLSAVAAAGKTRSICHKINFIIQNGDNVILVQPTKELIEETVKRLNEQYPDITKKVINGYHVSGSVMADIRRYLANPMPNPHVLIITWDALQRLTFIPNKSSWHLIIDEIPQVIICNDINIPNNHSIITQYLEHNPLVGKSYSLIYAKDNGMIRRISENKKNDRFWNELRDLCSKLESKYWSHYVLTDQYEGLLANDDKNRQLMVFSVLKKSILEHFASVLVAGADMEESLFHILFSEVRNVKFIEDIELGKYLRFHQHENGHLLKIKYAIDTNWSKKLRNSDNGEILQKIVDGIKTIFPTNNFIWSANKDIKDDQLFGPEAAKNRIPHSPHGLNKYDKIDNVVILSAYNPIPSMNKFIRDFMNLNPDQVTTAIQRQIVYQAIMRCSLRDPKNHNERIVFVPDLATAKWLQRKFIGSTIEYLDCGLSITRKKIGRPRIHKSAADKMAQSRDRMKARVEAIVARLGTICSDSSYPLYDENMCYENTILISNKVTQIRVTSIVHKEAANFDNHVANSVSELEQCLKKLYLRKFGDKEDNKLISFSTFDPNKSSETNRGLANIEYISGIMLDFDGGDLGPEDLAQIFPDLRMTIYSTYSSTKNALRFRVYIPISMKIDADTYNNITNEILYRIMDNGYSGGKGINGQNTKSHGMDIGKMHGASFFYLPCQPKDASGRYFRIFKGNERKELDVMLWIETMRLDEVDDYENIEWEMDIGDHEFNGCKLQRIENARNRWRDTCLMEGIGNQAFMSLAGSLAKIGCSEEETWIILTEESHYARSPRERIKDIPRIIKWLRNKNAFIAYGADISSSVARYDA